MAVWLTVLTETLAMRRCMRWIRGRTFLIPLFLCIPMGGSPTLPFPWSIFSGIFLNHHSRTWAHISFCRHLLFSIQTGDWWHMTYDNNHQKKTKKNIIAHFLTYDEWNKYRVILKKVSFGVITTILISKEEKKFTIKSKNKGLSLSKFLWYLVIFKIIKIRHSKGHISQTNHELKKFLMQK